MTKHCTQRVLLSVAVALLATINLSAQVQLLIEQPEDIRYFLFRTTDYSSRYTLPQNARRWELVVAGDSLSGLRAVAGDSSLQAVEPGLNADKATYSLLVKDPAEYPYRYRLYVRAYRDSAAGADLSFYVSRAMGQVYGNPLTLPGVSEEPRWFDTQADFSVPGGERSLLLSPGDAGLVITDVMLMKYDTEDPYLPGPELISELFGFKKQSPKVVTLSGIAALALPDPRNDKLPRLIIDEGGSEGVTLVTDPGADGYYSHSGNGYYKLTPEGIEDKAVLRFEPLLIGCYDNLLDLRIESCLRWFAPVSGFFSADRLRATLIFLDENDQEVERRMFLDLPGRTINRTGNRYSQACSGELALPTRGWWVAGQKVVLEVEVRSFGGESIYFDDIYFAIRGIQGTPEPLFDYTQLEGSLEVSFGNESGPFPARNMDFFWDFGDGMTSTDVTGVTERFVHTFSQPGDYRVCLTAVNCAQQNQGPCQEWAPCRRASTTCQTITVREVPVPAPELRAGTSAPGAAFRIFPNPASTELRIVTPFDAPLDYTLFDAFGRPAQRGRIDPQGSLGLNALAPGLYFLRLHTTAGEVLATERVVIDRN